VSRSPDEDNSSDPPSAVVCPAYATPPFPPFLHSLVELTSFRPQGDLYLDRRIDFAAISWHGPLTLFGFYGFDLHCERWSGES
jgi:hypothetical protein